MQTEERAQNLGQESVESDKRWAGKDKRGLYEAVQLESAEKLADKLAGRGRQERW